jgi:hypothetical protein
LRFKLISLSFLLSVQAVAETLLVTEGAGLPIAIVRPSIVAAAWKEPLPGKRPVAAARKDLCQVVDSIVAAAWKEPFPGRRPSNMAAAWKDLHIAM